MICVFTPQKEEKPQKEKPHLKKPQNTELKRVIKLSSKRKNSQKKTQKTEKKDYNNLTHGSNKEKYMCDCKMCIDRHEEKRKEEINRIKQAKKNKEFYVSPSIVSPV